MTLIGVALDQESHAAALMSCVTINQINKINGTPVTLSLSLSLFLSLSLACTHTRTHTHTHTHIHTHTHTHTHSYTAPTAYSAVAVSPFEMLFLNSIVIAPMFLFPVHPIPYMTNVIYFYYFGVIDHSGIKMESVYPWQPNTTFHDEHHRSALYWFRM